MSGTPLQNNTFDIFAQMNFLNPGMLGSIEFFRNEFAIPIDPTNPFEKAPQGFAGHADEWERNETFGLWLLHAWVWNFNPDGIFHETNPRVIVH